MTSPSANRNDPAVESFEAAGAALGPEIILGPAHPLARYVISRKNTHVSVSRPEAKDSLVKQVGTTNLCRKRAPGR